MDKERYSLFPFKEDITKAEYIAKGSTIIVSDEYVVSISEEFYGFCYLTRIASFSNN